MSKYTSLVTSKYQESPKFLQLVDLLTSAIDSNTTLVKSLNSKFDVDTAIGQQLDYVGQWVGLSRVISPAINNVFFSLDILGLGFDEGIWQSAFDTYGNTVLDDDTYRLLLKVKIILNQYDGTIPTAIQELNKLFINSNNILILEDKKDMSYNIGITGVIIPLYQALITRGYLDIRPCGVKVNYIQPSLFGEFFFGFDIDSTGIKGFDLGSWSQTLPTT